jgi:hypothetical protein
MDRNNQYLKLRSAPMSRGDEMAANIETGERQLADAGAASDEKSDQQIRATCPKFSRMTVLMDLSRRHFGRTPGSTSCSPVMRDDVRFRFIH